MQLIDFGYCWFGIKLWFWELPDKIIWRIAYLLPRSIALVAFIRVYSTLGEFTSDYERAYNNWESGKGK